MSEGSVERTEGMSADASRRRASEDYGADKIQHLEGIEGIRLRPAMYIGGTDLSVCITWCLRSQTMSSTNTSMDLRQRCR